MKYEFWPKLNTWACAFSLLGPESPTLEMLQCVFAVDDSHELRLQITASGSRNWDRYSVTCDDCGDQRVQETAYFAGDYLIKSCVLCTLLFHDSITLIIHLSTMTLCI